MNKTDKEDGPSASGALQIPRGDDNGNENTGNARTRLVADLPARLRPSASPSEAGRRDVDPKVAAIVRKWLELKESRGVIITQDLRKRHWYKSPDMMMSMMKKFGIDDRGTLFDMNMRGLKTRLEARALWDEYESRRSKERAKERERKRDSGNDVLGVAGPPKIEFSHSKQAAVQAALQAARAHAAMKGDPGRLREVAKQGKRQKR